MDDAVVDVKTCCGRLRSSTAWQPVPVAGDCRHAEVRSGVVYATGSSCWCFVPLFVLPGIEGRLFTPLGIAYVVSILAGMVVSVTTLR